MNKLLTSIDMTKTIHPFISGTVAHTEAGNGTDVGNRGQ